MDVPDAKRAKREPRLDAVARMLDWLTAAGASGPLNSSVKPRRSGRGGGCAAVVAAGVSCTAAPPKPGAPKPSLLPNPALMLQSSMLMPPKSILKLEHAALMLPNSALKLQNSALKLQNSALDPNNSTMTSHNTRIRNQP